MSKMSIDRAPQAQAEQPMARQTLSGSTMGTRYSAVFYMPPGANVQALSAALFAAVDRVDRQMSTWNPESDLNRLNAAPVNIWVAVPRELMTVLEASLQIERDTNGAFDIGVGELVSSWGFGPPSNRSTRDQNSAASDAARSPTCKVLELNAAQGRARKSASIKFDLSGIAKGYGVDELARVMDEFRIPSWLVGIDGEMRAKGAKPDGTMWAVAHERPERNVREALGVLELQDMAVATSGNYRHYREIDGRIVSHTMNPCTGAPLDNEVASATVLAPTCMRADAWATALMVMGVEVGLKVARSNGFDVIFVLQDGSVRSTL
jgi:FAD:protein FMN transferase